MDMSVRKQVYVKLVSMSMREYMCTLLQLLIHVNYHAIAFHCCYGTLCALCALVYIKSILEF